MEEKKALPLGEITRKLQEWAPLSWQEDYDNSGLCLGNANQKVDSIMICFDITPEVVEEAIAKGCQLIVSHHPPIFRGVKRIDTGSAFGRMLRDSMINGLAWYSMHTNLDNTLDGVNSYLAEKLQLQHPRALVPMKDIFGKLQVYVPVSHSASLQEALAEVGCGRYRNYDSCNWTVEGEGHFRALEGSHPFVGQHGQVHTEKEVKIECIYPLHLERQVIATMLKNHPYEEVAYDLIALKNTSPMHGAGVIGELPLAVSEVQLMDLLKEICGNTCIRHSRLRDRKIRKVALCGGSGASFIGAAQSQGADVYITGDIRYHDFAEPDTHMLLLDIGHFESEQFSKMLIHRYISENFPKFAVYISERSVNPVYCY